MGKIAPILSQMQDLLLLSVGDPSYLSVRFSSGVYAGGSKIFHSVHENNLPRTDTCILISISALLSCGLPNMHQIVILFGTSLCILGNQEHVLSSLAKVTVKS